MTPDAGAIAQASVQYGIPPALLYALGSYRSGYSDAVVNGGINKESNAIGAFGTTGAQLRSLGMQPGSVKGDIAAQITAAARLLGQSFQQYGSWQAALSAYLTGDPQAWESPTSAVGGQVASILGIAGSRATYGMDQLRGTQPASLFGAGSESFVGVLRQQAQMGGVVTQSTVRAFQGAAQNYRGASGTVGGSEIASALAAAPTNQDAGYSAGQCTWYVARSLGWIPGGLGNADDWASRASDKGFTVNLTPAVGAAVVWGANEGGAGPVGHVAVVKGVNPDGTFVVSEMNVDGQYVADERTVNANGVIGFIQPPPGTDMNAAAPGLKQELAQQAAKQPGQEQQAQRMAQRTMPQATQEPAPHQVEQFANQAQAAGLTPGDVQRLMPQVAPLRRTLLEKGTELQDLVAHKEQTQSEMLQHIRNSPHPLDPSVSAGELVDTFNAAALHSIHTVQRMPYVREASQFIAANFDHKDILGYYKALAVGDVPATQAQAEQPASEQQEKDFALQRRQRQQERGA